VRTVAKSLTVALVEPIHELQAAVQKVKVGEFDIDIEYAGQDGLGALAKDLQGACAQLHTIVADAGNVLGEMAEGRFDVDLDERDSYKGDFQLLISAISKLDYQLDEVIRQIRVTSEQVMVGSEQLANSAQELAEGATSQAGAVEELTATIESVTSISQESAINAEKAAENAKNAAEDARKSSEEINQLTGAMERITVTSKEIENIIAAIEDIASSPNVLSGSSSPPPNIFCSRTSIERLVKNEENRIGLNILYIRNAFANSLRVICFL